MRTYTTNFTTMNDIDKFIQKENIIDSSMLLIQIFCANNSNEYIKDLQKKFQIHFPKAILIGSTSDGVIDNNTIHTGQTSLISFSIFEHTQLKETLLHHDDTYHDYFKSGHKLAQALISCNTKLVITFTDGIYTNGENYLNGINAFSKDVIVSGGMAGDNGNLEQTYVFTKNELTSNGAVGVSLNSELLEVTTNYSFDWMPIGKKLRVTKSIGNRVYEIDGMSAVALYSKYLGAELAQRLPQIGIEFPLIIERNLMDTARAVLFKHDDESLTFAGNIREGELVRFGIGNIETILRGADKNIRRIITKSSKKIESVFIYSCMARRKFMGNYIKKELSSFANIAQTAGFFTYGEFFHTNASNQLLNQSMTILALSESNEKMDTKLDITPTQENYPFLNPLHILSHLTNTISTELEDLNLTLETRIKRNTDIIYKQAYYEKLTGLPNRLKLIHDLSNSIGKTLLLLNIDDFTLVNDFYGHNTGDAVLKEMASTLELFSVEEDALIYKLPADEFALIIQGTYSQRELESIIRKLLKILKNNYVSFDYYQIKVDVTISSAKINNDNIGFSNANMALKLAKSKNLNYLIFNEELMLSRDYEINLKIATSIREAIEHDNIIAYYQPIYNAKTNTIDKYESLVRLRLSNGDILSPIAFLDISKKIKLYHKITRIMVEKTFAYFSKNTLNFSINLSFEDILREETTNYIFRMIEHYDIGKQLTIEILENQEIENQTKVQKFIETIYSYGASIAIDDFGSGFANFQHLANLRANYLKIDGSLIKNITTDSKAKVIVETIIIFAKKLNMKTVAEFVHSKEVYDMVNDLGIDLLQGYYLDMPLASIE